MKYLSTEEYIANVNNLIKIQNRRIKKRFDYEADTKNISEERILSIMKKFDLISKYVNNEIMLSLSNIKGNDRYIFHYFDDNIIKDSTLTSDATAKFNAKYFKLIIKNKVTNMENFIIVTYDMREFFIKLKTPNSENDIDLIEEQYSLERFSRAKFRKIFFEYFIAILELDTMPRFRTPPIDTTDVTIPNDTATEIKILKLKLEKANLDSQKLNIAKK